MMTVLAPKTNARSITVCSSRTLPGQVWRRSTAIASEHRAAALAARFDVAGARDQIEGVVDEVFDFLIVRWSELAALAAWQPP